MENTSFQQDSCEEKHKSTTHSNVYFFFPENYITENKEGIFCIAETFATHFNFCHFQTEFLLVSV